MIKRLLSHTHIFSLKKMASQQTPHYELYDEEKDIMIYGIKIEALLSDGFEINSETLNLIHQMIPDVMDKCMNSGYSKKAIVLYNGGVMEILQMRYYFFFLTCLTIVLLKFLKIKINYVHYISLLFLMKFNYVNYIYMKFAKFNYVNYIYMKFAEFNCVNYISVVLLSAWKNGMQEHIHFVACKDCKFVVSFDSQYKIFNNLIYILYIFSFTDM